MRSARKFRNDRRRGTVLVLFAVVLMALIAILTATITLGILGMERRRHQGVANSAAHEAIRYGTPEAEEMAAQSGTGITVEHGPGFATVTTDLVEIPTFRDSRLSVTATATTFPAPAMVVGVRSPPLVDHGFNGVLVSATADPEDGTDDVGDGRIDEPTFVDPQCVVH